MQRILMPDILAARMKAALPTGQRSKVIARILEEEIDRRESELYECAMAVEADTALNEELEAWESTTGDGVEHQ